MVSFNPQIDINRRSALYGYNVGTAGRVGATGTQPVANGSQVQSVDVNAINELARRNAVEKSGIATAPATIAQAPVSFATSSEVEAPQGVKANAKMAQNLYGAQATMPSANKYNSFAAGNMYKASAEKNQGYGIYDGLANQRLGAAASTTASNPFASLSSAKDSNVTAGLSFAGMSNLNPDQKMIIA